MGVRIASQMKTVFISFSWRALSRARARRPIAVSNFGAALEIAQSVKFNGCWQGRLLDRVSKTNFPRGGFGHLITRHAGMKLRDGEFFGVRIGFHDTEI